MSPVDALRRAAPVTVLLIALGLAIACDSAKRDDSGTIVDGGKLDVFAMNVGDCFQDADAQEITDVSAVPCSKPHDNEVFHIFLVKGDTWPGLDRVEEVALNDCLPAFERYVGASYEDSALDYTWVTPTESSWKELDDREIACVLYDANLDRLTGSMKDSRR